MSLSSHPPSTGQHSEMTEAFVGRYEVQLCAHSEIHLHTVKSLGEPDSRKNTEAAFGKKAGAQFETNRCIQSTTSPFNGS